MQRLQPVGIKVSGANRDDVGVQGGELRVSRFDEQAVRSGLQASVQRVVAVDDGNVVVFED